MSTITVDVTGLSGSVTLELPSDSTVADAREAANINDGLSIRSAGVSLPDDAPLQDGAQLVTAPPSAKHG